MRANAWTVAAGILLALGCGGGEGVSSVELVSTDLTAYVYGSNVIVSYSDLSGSSTDWIGIGLPSDGCTTYGQWQYTGGGTSGTVSFTNLAPGTYDVRAYNSGDPDCAFRSSPFTVTSNSSVDTAASYGYGDDIAVAWTNNPTHPYDWVAIAAAGSPDTAYLAYEYTGGGTAGNLTFTQNFDAGNYEVRLFAYGGATAVARDPFTISGSGGYSVSTDLGTYPYDGDVTVMWSASPHVETDWIAISPQGSPDSTYTYWVYTGGTAGASANGSYVFTQALATGNWEARIYANDGLTVSARSAFTVGGGAVPTVSTASTHGNGSPIMVSWTNLNPTAYDWIALAPAGAPATTYLVYVYASAASGSYTFPGQTPGDYEVRAFRSNGYVLAASTPTHVSNAAVSTDASAYAANADVTVSWSGLPGNQLDWIAIAPAGSPNTTYNTWVYTYGVSSGSNVFIADLPAGDYVARVFLNNSFTLEAESVVFTVSGGAPASVDVAGTPLELTPFAATFTGFPANAMDWVAVAPLGAPPSGYLEWHYTGGGTSGAINFGGLPVGSYEVRGYVNNGFTLIDSSPFDVIPN